MHVIDLGQPRGFDADLRCVTQHWRAVRQGQDVPQRQAIRAAAIAPYLGKSALLSHVSDGDARFRLAGRSFTRLHGADVVGLPFRCLFHPASRGELAGYLAAAFDTPGLLTIRALSGDGDGTVMQLALMPLTGGSGAVDQAMVVLSGEMPEGPARLRSERALVEPLERPRQKQRRAAVSAPRLRVIEGGLSRPA